jgi:4-hydroxy-tetrahydrodipicolinate reductase
MGLEIAGLLAEGFSRGTDTLELSDAISASGRLSSIDGIPVRLMSEPPREPVHVWIDFSRPAGTIALLEQIDCPVLIGTTGLGDSERTLIDAYARRHPVLLGANTSPGMALMTRMLRSVSVSGDFAAVLEEDHHRHKKDAPSGTAKTLLQILHEQGHPDVQVHVTRAGAIVGTHTVRFIADGEELSLQHRVTDRKVFATGALLGALFLARQKTPRLYGMEDVGSLR